MDKQLETYLAQIKAQLQSLPPQKQDEELQEIRQHLQALAANSMTRGLAENEAVAAAIRQFGDSRRVGRDLQQAWRGRPEKPLRIALAAGGALLCHVTFMYVAILVGVFIDVYILKSTIWHGPNVPRPSLPPLALYPLMALSFCAPPFFAGWVAGLIAPRRAMMGIIPLYGAIALYGWLKIPTASLHILAPLTLAFIYLGTLSRSRLTKKRLACRASQ